MVNYSRNKTKHGLFYCYLLDDGCVSFDFYKLITTEQYFNEWHQKDIPHEVLKTFKDRILVRYHSFAFFVDTIELMHKAAKKLIKQHSTENKSGANLQ